MMQVKKLLLVHTATDTADLICDFITYSSDHSSICGGIKNAFDNIEKTTQHCNCINRFEKCDEHDHINFEVSRCMDYVHIYINISIASVIFDWELFFRNINIYTFGKGFCDCGVIPNEITFVYDVGVTNYHENCVQYICTLCESDNHICSSNVVYDDGPVHLTLNIETMILSII